MTKKERKKTLKNLGQFLSQFSRKAIQKKKDVPNNEPFFEALKMLIDRAQSKTLGLPKIMCFMLWKLGLMLYNPKK